MEGAGQRLPSIDQGFLPIGAIRFEYMQMRPLFRVGVDAHDRHPSVMYEKLVLDTERYHSSASPVKPRADPIGLGPVVDPGDGLYAMDRPSKFDVEGARSEFLISSFSRFHYSPSNMSGQTIVKTGSICQTDGQVQQYLPRSPYGVLN